MSAATTQRHIQTMEGPASRTAHPLTRNDQRIFSSALLVKEWKKKQKGERKKRGHKSRK
jgi:hypothetical protein